MSCFLRHVPDTHIRIPSNRAQQGVTYYTIAVTVGPHTWTVPHRYREFRELHERLVAEHGIAKDLLPPKKVLGNRAAAFLDQRQRQLELYLQQVLAGLQSAMCREFVEFLHFNRYDIVYLLQDMAQRFFLQGIPFVEQVQQYDFSVLELHAVAERLRMPCPALAPTAAATPAPAPNNNTTWKCYDFSHVLEFCTQLDAMRVVRRKPKERWTGETTGAAAATPPPAADEPAPPADAVDSAMPLTGAGTASAEPIGTSNIDAGQLPLDLGAFHALTALTLDGVPPAQLHALGTLRDTLRTLTVRRTPMRRLAEVLLCDSLHREADAREPSLRWPWLTHLDCADCAVDALDASVTLLPRLAVLRLDGNRLVAIAPGTLNQLPALSAVSLAHNRIAECVDWHLELGNIRELNLAGNGLRGLEGVRKMWSLVRLDVEGNRLADVEEVEHVAGLPCLEELRLVGNPMALVVGEWNRDRGTTEIRRIIDTFYSMQTTVQRCCRALANGPPNCGWTVPPARPPNWTWPWCWPLCGNRNSCDTRRPVRPPP